MNKARFEAFSDSVFVFAFAITFLVLGFSLPAAHLASERELTASLLALVLPVASFAAYVAIVLFSLIPHGVDVDVRTGRQDPSREPRKPANGGST
jgi:uncharacterized membrane protein